MTIEKNKLFSGFIILIYGLILLSCNYTKDKIINRGLLIQTDSTSCLPSSEFRLDNIKFSFTPDSIREKIGEPDSISIEPDFNSETLHYEHLDISIANNEIYYILSKDTIASTPSGLKIGLSKSEISKILFGENSGIFKIKPEATNVQFVNCDIEYYMLLDFESNKLIKLGMGIDLP
jgi:hypothetical protein